MMTGEPSRPGGGFRHEALLYAGADDFVTRTADFIRDGIVGNESVFVVVGSEKIDRLRAALGEQATGVGFADMADVGQNPARIILAWQAFVAECAASGRPFRGVGEPIWAARTRDELVECERHEALLNLAFADAPAWRLACPYDTASLPSAVIEEARRNHPLVWGRPAGGPSPSGSFRGLDDVARPFDRPLPQPSVATDALPFGRKDLRAVRTLVGERAAGAGLAPTRAEGLVLAAHEAATNSIRHGGGRGELRIWITDEAVICEVRDAGRIDDPLVGRRPPSTDQSSGFGLWLANQLCDLVQVRTLPTGSVVRLHVARRSS